MKKTLIQATQSNAVPITRKELPKSLTGIYGLDQITNGGLPKGRATLICGGTGTGKTMLAMEFLYRGITKYEEPGVFMAFEESTNDLTTNVTSLGFDLEVLVSEKKLVLDYVAVNAEEIVEAGGYNLDALFIRLGAAIDSVQAKRVVLDTIESLFSSLPNPTIVRAELRRLFRWLKDKGVTAVVTGESGVGNFTREGIEEYVSDCVINLTLHIDNGLASRGLRIVKYRGSNHGANEYPFVIDRDGFSLIPITSGRLDYTVDQERVSTGVPGLDLMLGGKGFYRGSAILISGASGTGKSTFMSKFAESACSRNERVVFFSFEESPSQISRNMRSIGIAFEKYLATGLLCIESARASQCGLDMHLLNMQSVINRFNPKVVIIDPITSLRDIASEYDLKRAMVKLIDYMKSKDITMMIGSLADSSEPADSSSLSISSLLDSWILLRDIESNGERNRALFIRKSRGMPHSNKVREFIITDHGVEVLDVFSGPEGILVGGAREIGSAKQVAINMLKRELEERDMTETETKIKHLHSQILDIGQELTQLESTKLKVLKKYKLPAAPLNEIRPVNRLNKIDIEKISDERKV